MRGWPDASACVEQVEQARRRLDEIAGPAERVIARDLAETDQPFVGLRFARVQPQRLGRRVMAGELARCLDVARPSPARARSDGGDRPGAEQPSVPPVLPTIVDSMPALVGPPSRISGMRPPRLASTCSARVGLIRPLALAEGAASGRPTASQQAPASPDARARAARSWAGRR